jgi:hypothetical protein
MSFNKPTNLRILFTLDSNRSTRFGVFSIHHHQEHLIVCTSLCKFTCFKPSEEQHVHSVAKNGQNKPGKCKQLSAPDDGV